MFTARFTFYFRFVIRDLTNKEYRPDHLRLARDRGYPHHALRPRAGIL